MTLPNFLIVGAPKCGTTALHHYLSEHPQVYLPEVKEPHFFADDLRASNYVRSATAYQDLFSAADDGHLAVGEASVFYLYSEVAAERIAESIPDVKMIVMLRDPIEMFVSFHNQSLSSLNEDVRHPQLAWELQAERKQGRRVPRLCEEPRYLFYGDLCRLGSQLEDWMQVFAREQVHCVLLDELRDDPAAAYSSTLEFLGLPDDARTRFPRVNAAHQPRSRTFKALHTWVDQRVRRSNRVVATRWVVRLLRPASRMLSGLNVKRVDKQELTPEFRARLVEYFAPDVEKLERVLGRDLPWSETYGVG